jgi:hypothetical protein
MIYPFIHEQNRMGLRSEASSDRAGGAAIVQSPLHELVDGLTGERSSYCDKDFAAAVGGWMVEGCETTDHAPSPVCEVTVGLGANIAILRGPEGSESVLGVEGELARVFLAFIDFAIFCAPNIREAGREVDTFAAWVAGWVGVALKEVRGAAFLPDFEDDTVVVAAITAANVGNGSEGSHDIVMLNLCAGRSARRRAGRDMLAEIIEMVAGRLLVTPPRQIVNDDRTNLRSHRVGYRSSGSGRKR